MEISLQLGEVKRGRAISHSARALRSRWLYYGVAASGLILHLAFGLPLYKWYDRLLAWVPLVIFLFLLRRYVLEPFKSIPILLLVALQIYVFFCLPQFSQDDLRLSYGEQYTPSSAGVTEAMLLVVTGELIFLFGFHLAANLTRKLTTRMYLFSATPTVKWEAIAKLYSVASFVIYVMVVLSVSYLPLSIRFLLTQFFNVYLALAILLFVGHSFDRKKLIALAYVLALGMSFVGLLQGMLSSIVGPFVVVFLARWVWAKAFDLRWVLFAVIAIILINPVKNEFRLLPSWLNPDISSVELVQGRLEDWSASFEKVWVERESDEAVYTSTASRTSELLSFTQSVDLVPDAIPYNDGEGIGDAMLFWIPRVLWPSKGSTTDLIYNRYAVTFGYLAPEDVGRTAVGISVFAEGYWNFGTWGVIAFLFLSGVLLGALFGNNGKFEQVSTLVCIVYIGPTILVLQALSVTLSSLPSFLIGVTIALKGLSSASRILQRLRA